MSAAPRPDMVCGGLPSNQAELPLASDGVQRFVWRMSHGDILVEVREGRIFVNGSEVEQLRGDGSPPVSG